MTNKMKKELWKEIPGFNGFYLVSSYGRIYSNKSNNFLKAYEKNSYIYVSFRHDGKGHHKRLNRLVANAFIPNPKQKPQVNHEKGNKYDNSVGNLSWVTAKENTDHAKKLGLRYTPKRYVVKTIKTGKTRTARSVTGLIKILFPKIKEREQIIEKRALVNKILYTDKKLYKGYQIVVERF